MKQEMVIELLHVHEECTGDTIVIFVPRESRFETFVVSALFLCATRLMWTDYMGRFGGQVFTSQNHCCNCRGVVCPSQVKRSKVNGHKLIFTCISGSLRLFSGMLMV